MFTKIGIAKIQNRCKKRGRRGEYIQNQLEKDLQDVPESQIDQILVAYEPVWAIGTHAKRSATDIEIVESIKIIKNFFAEKYNFQDMKVLYGGSVDEENAKNILDLETVDGLLVGRASSDPDKWEKLLNSLV
jgi:triosephosphate isomerase